MSHARQQIIERVATLVTGLATTGTNVYRTPIYPMETGSLPAVQVRFAPGMIEQPGEQTAMAPRIFQRLCRVEVIGIARATSNIDQDLNQISLEVEKVLAMPVSGPWKDVVLDAVEWRLNGDGSQPVGEIVLTYRISYFVREDAPDTPL